MHPITIVHVQSHGLVCGRFHSPVDQWVGLVGWKVGGVRMEEADPTDHHRSVPYFPSGHLIQTRCHVTH